MLDAHRGLISEENSQGGEDEVRYLRLVVRVPASEFDATLRELAEVATVARSGRTSEDVTTQVIDTDVRVRAQEASLKRIETLLARAESLKDIAWIESQLTQRQSELDSLRQQQTWLADQTSLATITLDISRTPKRTEPEPEPGTGFTAGLRDGWDELSNAVSHLAHGTGVVLPFLLPGLLLLAALWWVIRRVTGPGAANGSNPGSAAAPAVPGAPSGPVPGDAAGTSEISSEVSEEISSEPTTGRTP